MWLALAALACSEGTIGDLPPDGPRHGDGAVDLRTDRGRDRQTPPGEGPVAPDQQQPADQHQAKLETAPPPPDQAKPADLKPPVDVAAPADAGLPCAHQCAAAGTKGCQGNSVVTCGQYDADPCREWGGAAPCGAGKQCKAGACVCQPSCNGKVCGADGCGGTCGACPVASNACAGSNITRTHYGCVGGLCKGFANSGPCPFGCAGKQCKGAPAGSGGVMNMLWRWYNKTGSDHLSTISPAEKPTGYTFEGQSYYVPKGSAAGRHALYRLWQPSSGDHMSSTNSKEGASAGFKLEGGQGYPWASAVAGAAQLRRWYSVAAVDHLVAFSGENPSATGYSKEGSLGYGYPRYGNILHLPLSASGGGVKVTANRVAGGSVWELTWGGKQLINDYDFGRQVQVAFNLTNKAEVNNPTEAGSRFATPSMGQVGYRQGSPLVLASASGNKLRTGCRPLQWNPSLHGGGAGNPVVWDGFIAKELELGFAGMQGVVRWTTVVHFPSAPKYLDAEVVTAYLQSDYSVFWAYDSSTKTLRDMSAKVPGGKCLDPSLDKALRPSAGGVIIANPAKTHALGVYRSRGQKNFGLCKFLSGSGGQYGFATTKWNLLERHPKGVSAGTHVWTAYLVVGTVQGCVKAMDALYAAGY